MSTPQKPHPESQPWVTLSPQAMNALGANSPCPSLMDLAAFIDGKLSIEAARAIEAHIAQCSLCAEARADILAAQLAIDEPLLFVPPHVLEAAMALIKPSAIETQPCETQLYETGMANAGAITPRRRVAVFEVFLRRGAAVAALIGVCIIGHQVGLAIPSSAPASAADSSADPVATAMSFGVFDSSDESTAEFDDLFASNSDDESDIVVEEVVQ